MISSDSDNKVQFLFENQKIIFERNYIAKQADQSFVVHWNETVLLLTLCVSKDPLSSSFLPLTVEFQDNLFSIGKIPGGFFRREGRSSEYCILSARIIDRAIRHLFPKKFRHEVQIFVNPLAVDHTLDIRVAAVLSVSLLLNSSNLPINQLFAAISVGYIDNKLIFNPSYKQLQESELEMFLVGNEDKISMIEVSANQLPETKILEAIKLGHQKIIGLIKIQKQFLQSLKVTKKDYQSEETKSFVGLDEEITKNFGSEIQNLVENSTNVERSNLMQNLEEKVIKYFEIKFSDSSENNWQNVVLLLLSNIVSQKVREYTIAGKKRIDQRGFQDIRPLNCKIDYLPIVHGSAIFTRGETQSLSTITLGPTSDQKKIDDLSLQSGTYFMHHYKSLPFSMGLAQRMRGLSRREIGHGSLGEKGLKWILPQVDDFPYTIRIASEILASNGSTSQAAICSASLALMTAGVPISLPIAGVAIGLIKEGENYHLLSDIQAWEDFYGDMDFKIAGTEKGICAIQLDLKITGLPIDIIDQVLKQGKKDRLKILDVMNKTISKSRQQVAETAIKFAKLKLKTDEVKVVIGPSGKNIKKIIADNQQPNIDIQEDGTVLIYHQNQEILNTIKEDILSLVKPVEVGEVFIGYVDKIMEYGAFIKLKDKNMSGLLHISELSDGFVDDVNKFLKLNQEVKVKVVGFNKNKIKLKLV